MEHYMLILWLVAFVVFLIVEALTTGLYSIWFAVGSLGAIVVSSIAPELYWVQILVFLSLSGVSIAFLRPFADRVLKARKAATNADMNVGQIGKVVENINNTEATGAVYVYGKTWTARSSADGVMIPSGAHAKVVSIKGVKLIVEPAE